MAHKAGEGATLLKSCVCYPRNYLIPKLKSNGELGRSMASYGDAMVATAGILSNWRLLKISLAGGNSKGPIPMPVRTGVE